MRFQIIRSISFLIEKIHCTVYTQETSLTKESICYVINIEAFVPNLVQSLFLYLLFIPLPA